MKEMLKNRESNIELLRVFCILAVILLHYSNANMGGAFATVENDSVQYILLIIVESICAIAVNVFIIITGYFSITVQKRSIIKPLELILQVTIFRIGTYFIKIIINESVAFSMKNFLICILPVNYFVILYSVLYIISPFLNKCLVNLDRYKYSKVLIVGALLFSVEPIIVDVMVSVTGNPLIGLSFVSAYGSQSGYTIINFVFLYFIGGYIKLHGKEHSKFNLLSLFMINVAIICVWSYLDIRFSVTGAMTAWEYCNPIIILNAVIIFILFSSIDIGKKKWINKLSSSCFTVFLTHDLFLHKLNIDYHVKQNIFIILMHMISCAIILYFIGFLIDLIYKMVMKPLLKKIRKIDIDLFL